MATGLVHFTGIPDEIIKGAKLAAVVEDVARGMMHTIQDMNVKVGDRNGGPAEYDLPVVVKVNTTDRVRADVILAHPAGLAVQAKHGALTRAASEAGLEVSDG